jgi:epsilon-lactone hydrolase
VSRSLRFMPVTKTERRVATALALEPGGPPTAQARIAGQVIKALLKTGWRCSADSPAGLLRIQRITALAGGAQQVPRGVEITPEDFGRFSAEWVRAGAPDERRVLLYFHGGGYFFGSPRLYRPFSWRLSAATARPVLQVDYRLCPQHTPADALEDALTAYEALLARGYDARDIVVGGDSAGGHLTMSLLLELKRRGRPLPRAAVCLSPWVDLTSASESYLGNRRSDALIPADRLAWLGGYYTEGKEAGDPLFAPLRADLTGLPPLLLVASSTEILRDEVRDLAVRAGAAGVRVVHHEWDGLVHVFPVFADFIPEGRAAFRHIAEFIRGAEG